MDMSRSFRRYGLKGLQARTLAEQVPFSAGMAIVSFWEDRIGKPTAAHASIVMGYT
jgi:hypothetical protein